jgi:hypothetical protein
VTLNEKIRQVETEIQDMKIADYTSVLSNHNMKKFRTSLGGETVGRMDAGQMVLAFGMSTDVMSRNVNLESECARRWRRHIKF